MAAYPDDLTIILVSYNTRERLLQCLAALLSDGSALPRVVVVDNASADGSADAVAEAFTHVTLVRSPENVGFARGVNLALDHFATRFGLLLNPDTLPSHDLLRALVEHLDANPDIWAVAPRLLRPDGRTQSMDAGFRPSTLRAFVHFLGLAEALPLAATRSFCVPSRVRHAIEVSWLSGACLCFRRQILETVGPLDPSFFLYGEDLDWCRKIEERGGRLILRADLSLPHAQGASSGHDVRSPQWLSGLYRGYIRPIMGRRAALFYTAAAVGFGLRAIRALLPGYPRRPSTLAGYARAATRIALDALREPLDQVREPLARQR